MTVVQQPVQHGADGGNIAEQLAPVLHRPVRREQGAGAFIAAHNDLEQILGGGLRQLSHSEVVDDEQGDSPRNKASSRRSMKRPVARSNTRLRLSLGLN